MRTTHLFFAAPLFAVLAAACSDSSSSASSSSSGGPDAGLADGSTDTCTTDRALDVKITGLPDGAKAKVTVSGNGTTKTLDGAQKLTLAGGSYEVKAELVTTSDPIVRTAYKASVSTPSIRLCDDTSVDVTYSPIASSGKLWMSNANGSAYELAYTPAVLAATGSPPANVVAAASAAGGIAFDREGNLWGVGPTTVDATLERFPAGSLGDSGAKTPDRKIDVKGTGCSPSANAIAFDRDGNLWLSQVCEKRVVRLTPTDLSSTATEVTPAVVVGGLTNPKGLAFDANGNLFVADDTVKRFDAARLAASTSDAPNASITITDADSEALAFDANGDLWSVGGSQWNLTRIAKADLAATGDSTPTPAVEISIGVGALPAGIAFDEGGGLWVAGPSAGKFARLDPSQLGTSTTYADPTVPERVITSSDVGSAQSMAFFPAPATLPIFSAVP